MEFSKFLMNDCNILGLGLSPGIIIDGAFSFEDVNEDSSNQRNIQTPSGKMYEFNKINCWVLSVWHR